MLKWLFGGRGEGGDQQADVRRAIRQAEREAARMQRFIDKLEQEGGGTWREGRQGGRPRDSR